MTGMIAGGATRAMKGETARATGMAKVKGRALAMARATAGIAALALGAGLAAAAAGGAEGQAPQRWRPVEIARPANAEDAAVLGRPAALACDAERIYVVDAVDCAVKVFSRDGRFLRAVGRKGDGPGELSMPSGVAVEDGGIAVADKLNFRIQRFDAEGAYLGGFKTPFAPDRILSLGRGRLLVTSNPTGRGQVERLLHAYDGTGGELWAGGEAVRSGDPVGDTFRNMIVVFPGEGGEVFVVRRSGDRSIRRFSDAGAVLEEVRVDERHAFKTLKMPGPRGEIRLEGFCWAAAFAGGLFYLAAPDLLDGGRDLGPGRTVSVLDAGGRLRALIELPCSVRRFVVSGGRLFAIDEEDELRLFEVRR